VKVALLCSASVVATTLSLTAALLLKERSLKTEIVRLGLERGETETAQIVSGVHEMAQVVHRAILEHVNSNLEVAKDLIAREGGVSLSREEIAWTARNQLSKEEKALRLPKMLLGKQWFGQNRDTRVTTPLVDKVRDLVGGTATVFQRLNEQGDMLRIATTVVGDDGQRAVGTYIPALDSDGRPNPVVSTVLLGRRFVGRAFVVNGWYITGYEPLFDERRELIGMVYAGIQQEAFGDIHKTLEELVVGKTGYVWAVGGTGIHRGRYIISQKGTRDGEDIWEIKDANGRFPVQDAVHAALSTKGGEVSFVRYTWVNPGDPAPRDKVSAVTYFEPWDWVIGASTYQDDFDASLIRTQQAVNGILLWVIAGSLVLIVLLSGAAWWVSRRLMAPLTTLVGAAEAVSRGDLRQDVGVEGEDEIGQLAASFAAMVVNVRSVAHDLHEATRTLGEVVQDLSLSSAEQSQAISRQAAALQEAQATADAIRRASAQTALQSEEVLHATARADELAGSGQEAISQSLAGLTDIRAEVERIAAKIRELGERTQQIDGITDTVKDFADQSQLLALNASIEAARAGEHGKGFAVVADEVRKLAEQSIQSTRSVREILRDVSDRVGEVVALTQSGAQRVEDGLAQVRASGEKLGELSAMVTQSSAAIHAIAAAIRQQTAGVEQIFEAVTDLNRLADATLKRLESTNSAVATLGTVSQRVSSVVGLYRL
jgi:methyl-accepting chemotaxis protein